MSALAEQYNAELVRRLATEARLAALLVRLDNLIDGEGKLHRTWRKELEMVVPVDALHAVMEPFRPEWTEATE